MKKSVQRCWGFGNLVQSADMTAKAATAPCALVNAAGRSPVVLVCEHASNLIPAGYGTLGLTEKALSSHIAWDPGALAVARQMADLLDARLVHGTVSRLVYDCNRSPDAPDCIPAKSEVYDIPGNKTLSAAERTRRVEAVYRPFHDMLAETLATTPGAVLVTIHSFTPVYCGRARATAVGILHDDYVDLADAMLTLCRHHLPAPVERNEPYGPADGVTHTLREHGLKNGLMNVMIEIRNDLIETAQQQSEMARSLSDLLRAALARLGVELRQEARS